MYIEFSTGISEFNHAFEAWIPNLARSKERSECVDACIGFLERGLPTKVHETLAKKLSAYLGAEAYKNAIDAKDQFLCEPNQNWSSIIKGSDQSNPALDFYRDFLSKVKIGHCPINAIFFPEVKFSDVVSVLHHPEISNFEQVDFYSPLLDLIIEIDGRQHEGVAQSAKDRRRDRFSAELGLKVERLTTRDIKENTNALSGLEAKLNQEIIARNLQNLIITPVQNADIVKIVTIIRLQRFLLELMSVGVLGLDLRKWKLSFRWDENLNDDLARIAIEDLKDILLAFGPIFKMKNFKAIRVDEIITSDENAVQIDFSATKSFNSDTIDNGVIYVRNNHLIYEYDVGASKFVKDRTTNVLSHGIIPKALNVTKPNCEKLLDFCFNLPHFRSGQYRILSAALYNHAILGLLPTGGGKSLTFQFPSLLQNGCSIVVCPISALVRDHVLELNNMGFTGKAEYINVSIQGTARKHILSKLRNGRLKFLFVSPEQFQSEQFREILREACASNQINRFVIDEAHCLSEWGHDFRISYLILASTLKSVGENVPITCLTATASVSVVRDVQIEFDIIDENIIYEMSQSRPELEFTVERTNSKQLILKQIISEQLETGRLNNKNAALIFFPTVNGRAGAANYLETLRDLIKPLKVAIFTGKMPKDNWNIENEKLEFPDLQKSVQIDRNVDLYEQYKEFVQRQFKDNRIALMMATKSFGMGVNKPNIRMALHFGFAASIEALYQEAGRAGRDGNAAKCISLVHLPNNLDGPLSDLHADVTELDVWRRGEKDKLGDLDTQLFLFFNSVQSIEDEAREILKLYRHLQTTTSPTIIYRNMTGGNFEGLTQKTIYRLFQLGVIYDWTVIDHRKGHYNVYWNELSDQHIKLNYEKIVRKYEANNADFERKILEINDVFERKFSSIKEKLNQFDITFLKLAIWNKLTFFNFRRQSLLNLYFAYKSFDAQNPAAFKATLDSYFKIDKKTKSLTDALSAPMSDMVEMLVVIFRGEQDKLAKDKLLNLSGALMRLSESYPENSAIDLAYSIIHGAEVPYNQKLPKEVIFRLSRFISRLKAECDETHQMINLNKIYGLVSSIGESALSAEMIKLVDSFNFSVNVFENYEHNAPFVHILNDYIDGLGEAIWKN